MTGVVVKIVTEPGAAVDDGDPLFVVEAKDTGIHVNHFVLKNRDALAQWVKVELDEDESPNPSRTISKMAKNVQKWTKTDKIFT